MPQDAFTLYHNASELDGLLRDGKVNKINMPAPYEIVFYIYTGRGVCRLVASAEADRARACITWGERQNPPTPYNFCMLLRKHLISAEIEGVSLCGFERIIRIDFKAKNDFLEDVKKTVYLEIMGKYSNIFLTENSRILGALKQSSLDGNTKRAIFNGVEYKLPPSQDKLEPDDGEACINLFKGFSGGDAAKFLFTNIKGIAAVTAENIISNYAGGSIAADPKGFYGYLHTYLFSGGITPFVAMQGGVIKDFFAKGSINPGDIKFDTLSGAQDYFYTNKHSLSEFSRLQNSLTLKMQAEEKKHQKRLGVHLDKLKECANYKQNKIKGELITANIYKIKRGDEFIRAENYYEEDCPAIEIALDKNLSPAANAQKYFKKYDKQKKTIAAVNGLLEDTNSQLGYIGGLIKSIAYSENIDDLKEIEREIQQIFTKNDKKSAKTVQKKSAETAHRQFVIGGFKVSAGKSNLQNDRLLSSAKSTDLWLHVKDYHSSHVIIACEGKEPPSEVIKTAAEICAYYSEGRMSGKIPVDYCQKKYVKKPPKARPGAVIYTDFKTCIVTPAPHAELSL